MNFITSIKDILLVSEGLSGYIVWIISLFRRQSDTERLRLPKGVFVPGFNI